MCISPTYAVPGRVLPVVCAPCAGLPRQQPSEVLTEATSRSLVGGVANTDVIVSTEALGVVHTAGGFSLAGLYLLAHFLQR
jgi:hypothetical protein